MTSQALIHWLEHGAGARLLARGVILLGLATLSLVIAFKQFRGPRSEETLRQAVVGHALAQGHGFKTTVNYPQVHAFLHERGMGFARGELFPDLYQPPGYAAVIGAALAILPERARDALFDRVPAPPDGFGADYLLLALNVALLWIAAGQTWWLGRRWFGPVAGAIAAVGLLVSVGIWRHVVAVDGAALGMVLLLGAFQGVALADEDARSPWRRHLAWLLAGVMCGALFLTDYPFGVAVPLLGALAWRRGGITAAALLLGGALLCAAPWIARNVAVSGRPLALATQDVALRSGDPTADPAVVRTTLAAAPPALSLRKVANKALTAIEVAVRERVWSDGGLVFTAFFIAGWLYRFRDDTADRLRSWFGVLLLALVVAQGAGNSGEGERTATAVAAPLVLVFGAGFFVVLLASTARGVGWRRGAIAALLAFQAMPLAQDVLEPRQVHFSYPPYYPGLFQGMRAEMVRRDGPHPAWMADVPAGAAWYSGQRVWAQPATLREFYAVQAEQPLVALVLTPHTLDRPFFSQLLSTTGSTSRFGEWGRIYQALIDERLPADFPLNRGQRLADNFYVLLDPLRVPIRGN